ncbi:MAG: gliding motility-associated C-terminal domain-containing protein, partial [Bacteroidetes bacterium]
LSATTCDPNQAGTTEVLLSNVNGCDSLVITNTALLPADTTLLNATTCDPSQAGTTEVLLTNVNGCDSLVITNTALLPTDTTNLAETTCDSGQVGTFTEILQNQAGCDSIVITTVTIDPAACGPVISVTGQPVNCNGGMDGTLILQILSGQIPLQYNWENDLGDIGNGQINSLNSPVTVSGLTAGTYTVTVTDLNNLTTATATATVTEPPILTANAGISSDYNGFAVSCSDSADGAISGAGSGGTPPYQYTWNGSLPGSTLQDLPAGSYDLLVTDDNGCTAQASVILDAPPAPGFTLTLDMIECGDSVVDATVLGSGGIAPYSILLDGNLLAGTMPAIEAGQHTISLVDANGCMVDSTIQITLPPAPVISLPADTTIILGNSLQIEAITNLSTWSELTWQPLPDTSCAGCLVQEWAPQDFQQITVTIVDTFGCVAQATIRVSVKEEIDIYIPNVFSPNADGFNDIWQVNSSDAVAAIEQVQVFDRWGNLQYNWDNTIALNAWPGWDGSTGGKKAEVGVYVYYIEVLLANGKTEILKGDVTILER